MSLKVCEDCRLYNEKKKNNASICNCCDKKMYLVYQVGACEIGSEGQSSMHHVCVATGNTEDEVIENYIENVKRLYGYKLNPIKNEYGIWQDYYIIQMTEIKQSVYGHVEDYEVILKYKRHN